MPQIDTTSTDNDLGTSTGFGSGDVGSGGTTVNSNGTVTINPGSAAGNSDYEYEIVGLLNGVGSAYIANNNSNLACNSSVAVLNRNSAFAAMNSSSANLSNCANYVSQFGYMAFGTSKLSTQMCVSSIATYNFYAKYSSSVYTNTSMSVFPLNTGQAAFGNSSIGNVELESMTAFWGNNTINDGPVPTHFLSTHNSYIENRADPMSARIRVVGSSQQPALSGAIVEARNIKFLWSQIFISFPTIFTSSIFSSNARASYRYVPFSQSLDYGNIVNNGGSITVNFSSAGEDTIRGLISLLATGRNCYTSVKPPAFMYPPEDKSGVRYEGGLTGPYTMSQLLGYL